MTLDIVTANNIKMINEIVETIKNINWVIDNFKVDEIDKNTLREFQKEIFEEMRSKLSSRNMKWNKI